MTAITETPAEPTDATSGVVTGFILRAPNVYGLMVGGREVCQLDLAEVEVVGPVLAAIRLSLLVAIAQQGNELADTVEECFAPNAGYFANDLARFREAQRAWDAAVGE